MRLFWRSLAILLALSAGCWRAPAAGTRQERALAAAQSAFDRSMWSQASAEFAAFAARYPDAAAAPLARLMQAQAEIQLQNYSNAISLLSLNQLKAMSLADQYLNWIGKAQYDAGNFPAAAETFGALADNYTNSPLRLAAVVSAAAAWGQLGNWGQVRRLLEPADGLFQAGSRAEPHDPVVWRGDLLIAEGRYATSNYAGAASLLESRRSDDLPPELAWSWTYWLGQAQEALGESAGALSTASNLVSLARASRNADELAGSLNLRAAWLEQAGQTNAAVADYQENLGSADAPAESRRQAVLQLASLLAAQGRFATAEARLNDFLERSPQNPAAAAALFSLGDLHLKHYAAEGSVTNLQLAQACLDQFLGAYTNSSFCGPAYLDRGWCGWLVHDNAAAAPDFRRAAALLPRSFDQAVARFKLADALYGQADYTNAWRCYQQVVEGYPDVPAVAAQLVEAALYQSLRASEEMRDGAAAAAALDRILTLYPDGDLSDNAILVFGENEAARGRPGPARQLFQRFARQFPHSELLPEARLAVARTYEEEGNWPAAITNYEQWLGDFPGSELRPGAAYAAARAQYQSGNETNALSQFTRFIADYPGNRLAPQAQWWVADYFFRTGAFGGAETNYENIFQNPAWKTSPLVYPAQFMAGRAAMARNGDPDATRYFSTLINDPGCPAELGVRARFACAAAWMQIPSADTNDPGANFATAISFLSQIVEANPTNSDAARAWGETGDCDFQLGNYDAAESAYEQVFGTNAPAMAAADAACRGAAMVGSGLVLERRADAAAGADRARLLQQALDRYLAVFDMNLGVGLRAGEQADPFWIKKAGLQALPLIETLGCGDPGQFVDQMETVLPSLKAALEKIRAGLPARPVAGAFDSH